MPFGNEPERLFLVEDHMGRISSIVPFCKPGVVALEFRHHRQQATRPKHPVQPVELVCWVVKVLHNLRGGDKVVRAIEDGAVGRKVWVEQRHSMASLAQHRRHGGGVRIAKGRSAAKVETHTAWGEPTQKRLDKLGQECAVAGVIRIVLVALVPGAFRFRIQMVQWAPRLERTGR